MAVSEAAKEARFLSNYLSELKLLGPDPPELHVDNQAARDLAYNPEHHKRTKHIDRRHFFVRDMVEQFELEVPYVPTNDNLSDFFAYSCKPYRSALSDPALVRGGGRL